MDDRVGKLLLKAIRTLPQREQDVVLAALVGSAIGVGPGLGVPAGRAGEVAGSPVAPPDVLKLNRPGPSAIGRVSEASGPFAMLPVRLPPELHERLRRWSIERGFSMAAIVRGLLERFLDEQAGGRPARTRAARSRSAPRPAPKAKPKSPPRRPTAGG